jgi:threonine aldolase
MIEMRSDTFTLPTAAMLEAMVSAPLGDDVYGEDPTVNRLETLAAQRLGKESACLMPSGTMANLASIMAHCPRGSSVIVGSESDIYLYEAGGAAACGSVTYVPVPNRPDGTLALSDLAEALPPDLEDPQFAVPALICLENTQNRCGGRALSDAYQASVQEWAHGHGLAVHLDGARVFNAAVALGVPASEVAAHADSVQFCLSKGLSAPIGSIVAGSGEFIARVRRIRKMLGGGMRQAGVIAAAGIVALEDMVDHLATDHALARRLAEGLGTMPGIALESMPETNIILFRVLDPRFTWSSFVDAAGAAGVALIGFGHDRIRAVTHSGLSTEDIDRALDLIAKVLA